jgi:hypothetical protein
MRTRRRRCFAAMPMPPASIAAAAATIAAAFRCRRFSLIVFIAMPRLRHRLIAAADAATLIDYFRHFHAAYRRHFQITPRLPRCFHYSSIIAAAISRLRYAADAATYQPRRYAITLLPICRAPMPLRHAIIDADATPC